MLDSVDVANEIADEARENMKNWFIFKIDFARAYDSMSWDSHMKMLKKLKALG